MPSITVGTSGIAGKGVFAEEDIPEGELILLMTGKRVTEAEVSEYLEAGDMRWDDPFEIGNGEYILLDEVPLRINHACEPNAGIRGRNELFALRNIKKGEELFYDYSTMVGKNAPDETDWLMPCACGARTCRGIIGNWLTLPTERLDFYETRGALPDFVLAQLVLHPQAL